MWVRTAGPGKSHGAVGSLTARTTRGGLRRMSQGATANPLKESSTLRRVGAVVFSGTACLGGYLSWWQMQRHQWKVDLIEQRRQKMQTGAEPLGVLVPSTTSSSLGPELEYRQVESAPHPPIHTSTHPHTLIHTHHSTPTSLLRLHHLVSL